MRGTAREARLARRPFIPAAVLIAEAEQEVLEEDEELAEQARRDEEDAAWSDNYGDYDEDFPPVFADERFDDDLDMYGEDSWLLDDLDRDEDWGYLDDEDYRDESTPGAEAVFLLDPIGTGDPELERVVHGGLPLEAIQSAMTKINGAITDYERLREEAFAFRRDPLGSGDPELLRQTITAADLYPLESFGPGYLDLMRQYQAELERARFLQLLEDLYQLLQILEEMEERTFWSPWFGGYEFEVSERSGYTGWYRYSHGRLPSGLMPEWNANTGEVRYRR